MNNKVKVLLYSKQYKIVEKEKEMKWNEDYSSLINTNVKFYLDFINLKNL